MPLKNRQQGQDVWKYCISLEVQCPGVSHHDGKKARLAHAIKLEIQLSSQSPVPPSNVAASASGSLFGVSGLNLNGLIAMSYLAQILKDHCTERGSDTACGYKGISLPLIIKQVSEISAIAALDCLYREHI